MNIIGQGWAHRPYDYARYNPVSFLHYFPQRLLAAVNASVSCSVGFNALGFIRPTGKKACKMIVVSEWVLCDREGKG